MRVPRLVVMGACALTAVATSLTGAISLSGQAASASSGKAAHKLIREPGGDPTPFLGGPPSIRETDVRGFVAPTAAVRRAVGALGADVDVSYNRFGTPSAITTPARWLATGLHGGAVKASRAWLSEHRALFNLTSTDLENLELVNNARLVGSPAHAVLFRQSFDGVNAGNDGLVAIGIRHDKIASVTSTLVGGIHLDATKPVLSPLQAVLAAAHDDGRHSLTLGDLSLAPRDNTTFTNVTAKGLAQLQRTRLVALPTVHGAKLAYETDITDVAGGAALATISFVDALSGRVLVRHNVVDTLDDGAGTPQAAVVTDQASADSVGTPYPPEWKYFEDAPNLGHDNDTRTEICWTSDPSDPSVTTSVKGCQQSVINSASPDPWDVLPQADVPTFSTTGNNATEAEAWYGSTLTPGEFYHPVSAGRTYTFPFTDEWYRSRCNPTDFTSLQRNDIDAVITNLFVGHNLFHDFAYRLGFTEKNYNLQTDNFGLTGPARQDDAEIGDVQSGAVTNEPVTVISGATGEALPVEGRDNANQITLQDGVPGITNQYLFQPIVGFYGPCHDGDLDMSVYGHEYTHAISNRMIAGPDTSLSGTQGGSMGESWSDLDALEFLNAMGYAGKHGETKDSIGAYVTGNKKRGIRDFELGKSPLNYSDFGFDTTGPEVHADGEIWNAVQWQVRKALIKQYEKKYPASDHRLERACAIGQYPNGKPAPSFNGCPGDRHWIQYIYDSFLLEANGAPTMVDMKNLMLSAQKLRTNNRDRKSMADAFARGGLGEDATAKNANDTDPVAGFASPISKDNAHIHFVVRDAKTNKPVPATIYVGKFQARVTPYASTLDKPGHPGDDGVMVHGRYHFLVQAKGYGERRFTAKYHRGRHYTQVMRIDRNYASAYNGARISGQGTHLGKLIDDDESTDVEYDGSKTKTPVDGVAWTVALDGSQRIGSVRVSAEHHPPAGRNDFQSRLTDLRAFAIQVSSDGGNTYRTVKNSGKKFFPGRLPRPVVPDLILRSLSFHPATADHVRLVVHTNQCTGFSGYRDKDNDPLNDGDCRDTADAYQVSAAELQVFRPDHKRPLVLHVHGHKHHKHHKRH